MSAKVIMWEKALIGELGLEVMVIVLHLSQAHFIRFSQKLAFSFLFGSSST